MTVRELFDDHLRFYPCFIKFFDIDKGIQGKILTADYIDYKKQIFMDAFENFVDEYSDKAVEYWATDGDYYVELSMRDNI